MSTAIEDIVIDEVDLANLPDDDVVGLNEFDEILRQEARPEDPPTPLETTRTELQNIPGFVVYRSFWARRGGRLVATGGIQWTKTDENKHMVWSGISVHPDYRRRGIAKAILGKLVEVAEREGRTLMMTSTSERVPAGAAFAERVGAEGAMAMHQNRLDLDELDRGLVRRWVDEGPGRAPGYSLITVDGRYPDDLIADVVDVYHVMNDAPRDDLQMDDTKFTVEQTRDIEKTFLAMKYERWALFARHDATGRLVGLTNVIWDPDHPETVFQGDTGVRPEHRGHALGKWLKAVMLQRILDERPGAKDVRTGNADSNDAMLGINHELGFKPYIANMNWQVPTEKVRDYVSGSKR